MSSFRINVYEKNNHSKKYSLVICKKNWYFPFLIKTFSNRKNYKDGILSISSSEDQCLFYEYKNPSIITNIFDKDLKRFFPGIKLTKKY